MTTWRKFGFDQVYMQPNHYWKPENDLDSACMKINRAGTSIEFEFEASISAWIRDSDICRARMRKYMKYAKKHGIYGTRPLAYYQGSNAPTTFRSPRTKRTGSSSTNSAVSS